ncbi:uncharacterized protein [Haliotis cracherodii]|uniref:uncharacterized protein n=1 Tax=Haliotis cracherodii TaxID=6455 RepID=UPI0039ED2CCC
MYIHDKGSDPLYIVVGAVGGAALPTVVVVGVVCIRRRRKMKPILFAFVFTIITTVWAQDTAVIHCPDIAYLGTPAQITCSTSDNFNNTIYKCPCGVAPMCQVSDCTNVSGYNASIINQTQTEITIISVQPRHAGNWSCTDAEDVGTTFCLLVVAKIPSVNITSDVDADSVYLGDRISLTVDIGDYHCSDAYSLTLQVGSATYTRETGRNATVRHLTKNVPILLTQTRFVDVKFAFVCGNHQWNITPGGVNELQSIRIRKVAVVYSPSEDAVHQAEDKAVVGPGGSASDNDQQELGLRINPVYVPTTVGDRIVTTGASTETGGDNLHPETRGEYVALDRNAVQPSNIYEHLTTYEVIGNM